MKLMDRLERSVGPYAIPNLTLYLMGGQLLLFLIMQTRPEMAADLVYIPNKVLEGEVWRLLTFIFYPAVGSVIGLLFGLYVLWWTGRLVEQAWGAFRFNLYIGVGMAFAAIGGFAYPAFPTTNLIVLESIFLAVAVLVPNMEVRLYFLIPVKMKWLGFLIGGAMVFQAVTGGWPTRIMVLTGTANFLLFFGPSFVRLFRDRERQRKNKKQWERKMRD